MMESLSKAFSAMRPSKARPSISGSTPTVSKRLPSASVSAMAKWSSPGKPRRIKMLDSEKKKMLAGKLYHAGDREIQADQATAKAWGRDCQHSFEPGQSHGQFTLILSANAA